MKLKVLSVLVVIAIVQLFVLFMLFSSSWLSNESSQETKLHDYSEIDLKINQPYQITKNTANHERASIYENKIVWQDDRFGNWDIFMLDLSTGKEITNGMLAELQKCSNVTLLSAHTAVDLITFPHHSQNTLYTPL